MSDKPVSKGRAAASRQTVDEHVEPTSDGKVSRIDDLPAQLMEVQTEMQRENAAFTSISNVLKTRHDTSKNSIDNVK